jgi:hypothetical protein
VPFEIEKMEARPDGFLLTFTGDIDAKEVSDPASYAMTSYTYLYHQKYGSDEVDTQPVKILAASVDGRMVRLTCQGLREGYVHELHAEGVRDSKGRPLLHSDAYYTLNHLPKAGPK